MATQPLFHLLVVDDDDLVIDAIKLVLPKNWRMTSANRPENLDARLNIHAAFVDMHLTAHAKKAEGPEVIKMLSANNPNVEIIAMSGDLSLEMMEECLKEGARKFLAKPLQQDEFLKTLEKIESVWLMRQLDRRGGHDSARWVGSSEASLQLRDRIAQLRGEWTPILIEAETGCGKEVVFRLLNHQEGNRPFVAVNIAGIPENLFESEMFGHVKGAFTGADQVKMGLCEAAHGGDLFLDEIEALSLPMQVKLLRFLETGEVRKVGAKEAVHVKTRVITATNQNLQELVRAGKFREDLLFRVSGHTILIPPLRQRKDDIGDLAKFFLDQQRPRSNKILSPDAIEALRSYSWPGNTRELKRICEQLSLTSPLPIIRAEDLSRWLGQQKVQVQAGALDLQQGLDTLVAGFEKIVVEQALQTTQDVDSAAHLLKISRSSIYKKIKDYSITTP
jgi:DNA-binding NtrC family response regulator